MERKKLKKILKSHKLWLKTDRERGTQAELHGIDLSGHDLKYIDLGHAILCGVNFSGANCFFANFRCANLRGASFQEADLKNADLRSANLRGANLSHADLKSADLANADLRNANLSHANLHYANLTGANLTNAIMTHDTKGIVYDSSTAFYALQCPEEGAYIGYKKAGGKIIKLEIQADALRSSATSRKCRCSKAKVLSITDLDGTPSYIPEIPSDYDSMFVYRVGEVVEVPDFDRNRWNECSTGIHHFITRQEAVLYEG